jgi:penicillin-binding protein 1A
MSIFKSGAGGSRPYFWIIYGGIIGSVLLFFILLAVGLFGALPSLRDLENPQTALATEVISADGVVLGKYFEENRTNIHFENLPKPLVNALLATEDVRFYEHTGVDLKAIGRAVKGVVSRDSKGGGSTITQQLAKNLFPRKRLNKIGLILRKFKEWIIAVRLEHSYTKDEIIAMYFNTVPFSDNAYGINTAALTYFSKPVDSLNIQEAAVLVGMLKGPSEYNPRLHPEASKRRRNVVIDQLYNYEFITETQRDSLFALPIELHFDAGTHEEGMAPYFREYLRLYLRDYFEHHLKPDGTKYNLYKDGLKIYTTIDSRMQTYAEEAQREHLTEWQDLFFKTMKGIDPWKDFPDEWERTYTQSGRYKQYKAAGKTRSEIDTLMSHPVPMKIFSWQGEKDTVMSPRDSIRYHRMMLQNGFLAMDPGTGAIRVWVGGDNYKYFQYDHVNINTKRQIGSTFKPFIYTAAVRDKGYSPCYEVPNQPVTFEKGDPRFNLLEDWTPHNSDGEYGGILTLMQGLANSVNTITAYLMHEMSPETVVRLAHEMGIKSEIPNQPSICLGTADISVIEMAGAYTCFVNKGVHVEPIFLDRIEDRSGNVIATFVAERHEALDEQTAYVMVEMLRGVVRYGTGVRLRYRYHLMGDILGKTGTTQNNSDGWFIGCTPELITASWVGCEDRFIRFQRMLYGQGASSALPINAKFLQKVYSDSTRLGLSPGMQFAKPEEVSIELNCRNYKDQSIDRAKDFGSEDADSTGMY